MDKEELIQFLKDNLTIEVITHYGNYGVDDIKEIEIKLQGETITSDYL